MLAVEWVLVARMGLKGKLPTNGWSKQDEQANSVRAGLPRESGHRYNRYFAHAL